MKLLLPTKFGMRESWVRVDSRVTPRGPTKNYGYCQAVNREEHPTKNNITFYGQPNFVACYKHYSSMRVYKTHTTTSVMPPHLRILSALDLQPEDISAIFASPDCFIKENQIVYERKEMIWSETEFQISLIMAFHFSFLLLSTKYH